MSAETLQDLEDAIAAHHRDTCENPDGDRANAVVTAWSVAYEISNVVDVDGESVVGYMNEYITGNHSPNTSIALATWSAGQIEADAFSSYGEDDD